LLFLGIVVGILNIGKKEVSSFLLAAVAFMFTFTSLGKVVEIIPVLGEPLARFFSLMNAFVAPAAAVVAFKALFAHSKH
jgi:ABC-type proline/glycine betaine transport system permease subunit